MARLILDTTVLISAERSVADLNSMIDDEDDVAIAAITAAELLVGVEMADTANQQRRRVFVDRILVEIDIEDYDLDVAKAHAELLGHVRKTGRPRGAHDLIIAATAAAARRTVVTANKSDFQDLPGVSVRAS